MNEAKDSFLPSIFNEARLEQVLQLSKSWLQPSPIFMLLKKAQITSILTNDCLSESLSTTSLAASIDIFYWFEKELP